MTVSVPRIEEFASDAERLTREVMARVRPRALVDAAWPDVKRMLGDDRIDLLAIGKASLGMAHAVCEHVVACEGDRFAEGLVLASKTRSEEAAALEERLPCISIREVDHPTPTERNVQAAAEVEAFIRRGAGRQDASRRMLLALISGGGSAHLTLPAVGVRLDEIAHVAGRLMRAGADINELNTVRKHLEKLKGGRLAAIAAGYSRVVGILVSDVIGDDLSVIASGPLAADPTTYADALDVLRRRGIARADAPAVWAHLERGLAGEVSETPKPGDPVCERVVQRIIGSNAMAIGAACGTLNRMGFRVVGVREGVVGEASERAFALVDELSRFLESLSGTLRRMPIAVVWGGETTVTVGDASGVGGRNQEFVLAASKRLSGMEDGRGTAVFSFATDGVDGPTDASGAFATSRTWKALAGAGVDPQAMLDNHDSYRALERVSSLLRTGPTGTNVNDVMVALAYPEEGRR